MKPNCSEHKHVKKSFPGETAESLGLKIGRVNVKTRHKLIRALGKQILLNGQKDFSEDRVILGVLLQALGEVLKRIGDDVKGTPPLIKPPISSLSKMKVERLAVKIADLHYEDFPTIFESIKESLERKKGTKTLKEREALLYSTRIAKKIREISKPHMENSN